MCSTNGEIVCQLQDGVSGLYNTSFVVSDAVMGLGNPIVQREAWQVDLPTGQLFTYKAHPTITSLPIHALGLGGSSSISETRGGAEGGTGSSASGLSDCFSSRLCP